MTIPEVNSENHRRHHEAASYCDAAQQTRHLTASSGENKKSRDHRKKEKTDDPI